MKGRLRTFLAGLRPGVRRSKKGVCRGDFRVKIGGKKVFRGGPKSDNSEGPGTGSAIFPGLKKPAKSGFQGFGGVAVISYVLDVRM